MDGDAEASSSYSVAQPGSASRKVSSDTEIYHLKQALRTTQEALKNTEQQLQKKQLQDKDNHDEQLRAVNANLVQRLQEFKEKEANWNKKDEAGLQSFMELFGSHQVKSRKLDEMAAALVAESAESAKFKMRASFFNQWQRMVKQSVAKRAQEKLGRITKQASQRHRKAMATVTFLRGQMQATLSDHVGKTLQSARLQWAKDELKFTSFRTCACVFNQWQRMVNQSVAERTQAKLGREIKQAHQRHLKTMATVIFLRGHLQDTIRQSDQRHVREAEKREALEKDMSRLEMQASLSDRASKEQQSARLQRAKDKLKFANKEFRAEALSAIMSRAKCEQHECIMQELRDVSAEKQEMLQHEISVVQRQKTGLEEQCEEKQCQIYTQQATIDMLINRLDSANTHCVYQHHAPFSHVETLQSRAAQYYIASTQNGASQADMQTAETQTETYARWARAVQTQFDKETHQRPFYNCRRGGISADEKTV